MDISDLGKGMKIAEREFDAVVFGHTHWPGVIPIGEGKSYINTGSWLSVPHYLEISNGEFELKEWGAPSVKGNLPSVH